MERRLNHIGELQVREVLGSGAMGTVYLCTTPSGEHVAVKTIREELAANPVFAQRFARESRIATRLRHPNIVACRAVGSSSDGPYMVLEYVEGGTLEALVLRHGPLPDDGALRMVRAIAAGLAHAHELGLIHRDLKPQNILITAGGAPKISDLGLARGTDASATRFTAEGVLLGTPLFMSPEQGAGELDLDARTDYYALGGLLYFLVTGRPPYSGSLIEVLAKHATADPPDPTLVRPSVHPAIGRLIGWLMQKRREDRPSSPAMLEVLLDETSAALATGAIARDTTPDAVRTISRTSTVDAPLLAEPGPEVPGLDRVLLDIGGAGRGMLRIFTFARERIVFGRDATDAVDLVLRMFPARIMEPQTLRISGEHGRITVGAAAATLAGTRPFGPSLEDAGSRNGTWMDGERLAPHTPVALRDGGELDIGRALRLGVRIWEGREGLDAVLLTRRDNAQHLAYLIVRGEIALGRVVEAMTGGRRAAEGLPIVRATGGVLSIAPGTSVRAGEASLRALPLDPAAFKTDVIPEETP